MIIGPGHGEASASGHGHMRASDVDREQSIDVLKAAFTQGRLTKDELDERVGTALSARTHADLQVLTADIPRDVALAPRPRPARATGQAPVGAKASPRERAYVATATLAGLAILVAFVINDGALSAMLALGGVASAFVSFILLAAHIRAERRDRLDKPDGRRSLLNRALDAGPGAGWQSAPDVEQLPSAQPRRRSTTDAASTHRRGPHAVCCCAIRAARLS